jgi:hypothetical protein
MEQNQMVAIMSESLSKTMKTSHDAQKQAIKS